MKTLAPQHLLSFHTLNTIQAPKSSIFPVFRALDRELEPMQLSVTCCAPRGFLKDATLKIPVPGSLLATGHLENSLHVRLTTANGSLHTGPQSTRRDPEASRISSSEQPIPPNVRSFRSGRVSSAHQATSPPRASASRFHIARTTRSR